MSADVEMSAMWKVGFKRSKKFVDVIHLKILLFLAVSTRIIESLSWLHEVFLSIYSDNIMVPYYICLLRMMIVSHCVFNVKFILYYNMHFQFFVLKER